MTAPPSKRPSFISRNSILLFIILAMLLGGGTVYLVYRGVIPKSLALGSAISASISGIIITALVDGRSGLRLLFRRLSIWRVGTGYWIFSVFFLVPIVIIGFLLNPVFGGDPPIFRNLKLSIEIVPIFIAFFIVAGLGQELGWTGFLLPRLQSRFNSLVSALIRAVLGTIWHLPLYILAGLQHPALADFPYQAWIAQKGYLVAIVTLFLMFQIPWSIFFTWVFNNTRGSLLLAAVMHGSEILVAYTMVGVGIDQNNLNNYWGYGFIMILLALIIVLITGPSNLSRKHERISHENA